MALAVEDEDVAATTIEVAVVRLVELDTANVMTKRSQIQIISTTHTLEVVVGAEVVDVVVEEGMISLMLNVTLVMDSVIIPMNVDIRKIMCKPIVHKKKMMVKTMLS